MTEHVDRKLNMCYWLTVRNMMLSAISFTVASHIFTTDLGTLLQDQEYMWLQ
jgi:hypothetical protein